MRMITKYKLFEKIKKEYVVDVQYDNVPKHIFDEVFKIAKKRGMGQNSYFKHYVCGTYKPKDEVKDKNNIVIEDPDSGYCYETGDEVLSDWLLEEGIKPGTEVTFKIWW